MAARDWDAERGRQLVARTFGSPDGEGGRWEPAIQPRVRIAPSQLRVQRVFALTKAEVEILRKQLVVLNNAAQKIESARALNAKGSKQRAGHEARAAWGSVKPLISSYGQSKNTARLRIAKKLRVPFRTLERAGLDFGLAPTASVRMPARSTASEVSSAVCPACYLELSPVDRSVGRKRHEDC